MPGAGQTTGDQADMLLALVELKCGRGDPGQTSAQVMSVIKQWNSPDSPALLLHSTGHYCKYLFSYCLLMSVSETGMQAPDSLFVR